MNLVTALALILLPLAAIPQSLPTTSLNSPPVNGSSPQFSIPHVSVCSQPDKASEPAILTICIHERGMTALPQPRLYLRVFADGRGEFETNGNRLDNLVLKEVRLTEGELNEIVCLGRESDFQEADASYPAIHAGIDSSRKTTVTFRDGGPGYEPDPAIKKVKKIVVNNYYAGRDDNFEHYPSSFNALMDRAESIWKRAMGIPSPKPQVAGRQSRESGESRESGVQSSEFGVQSSASKNPQSAIRNPQLTEPQAPSPKTQDPSPKAQAPSSKIKDQSPKIKDESPKIKDQRPKTQVQPLSFCDLLRDRSAHIGREVTLEAIYEYHVIATRDGKRSHTSQFLRDPQCEIGDEKTEKVGARFVGDFRRTIELQARAKQVYHDEDYRGRALMLITGTLRHNRAQQPPDYPYSFEISDILSIEPVILLYRGKLLNGWTFSDTFEVTRAALAGSRGSPPYEGGVAAASADGVVLSRTAKTPPVSTGSGNDRIPKSSPPYEGGVAAASADGVVLSRKDKAPPAQTRSTAHLPKTEPNDGFAASLIKLSSPLAPIKPNPYWPKGSTVEPHIEWRNPTDFPALFQPGRKHIIFRVSYATTAGIAKNRFTETYTCEILSLVSSQ